MAKTSKTYRLSDDGLAALDKVAKRLGLNRTATIELVMRRVVKEDNQQLGHEDIVFAEARGGSERSAVVRAAQQFCNEIACAFVLVEFNGEFIKVLFQPTHKRKKAMSIKQADRKPRKEKK